MIQLFLRVVLAIVMVRFLGGLFRALDGGSKPRQPEPRPPKSLVDRASAIDVPFTEERREG
jgi:hypothetical protein